MGNLLVFKPKGIVEPKVEDDIGNDTKCDGCGNLFPEDKTYINSDGEQICGNCIGKTHMKLPS